MTELLEAFAAAIRERALLFDAMREVKRVEQLWIARNRKSRA